MGIPSPHPAPALNLLDVWVLGKQLPRHSM
jgi:hypothetical protein